MNVLVISGSLRTNSSTTAIVRALASLATLAPQGIRITVYAGLGSLPHFNPDLDGEGNTPPESVSDLRARLRDSDGIILCTPEYAFGIPGSLKNALDWIVSSGEFLEKPTIAISSSPSYLGGDKALSSLLLTLSALGANVVEKGTLVLPFIRKKQNSQGEIVDGATLEVLRQALDALTSDIHNGLRG